MDKNYYLEECEREMSDFHFKYDLRSSRMQIKNYNSRRDCELKEIKKKEDSISPSKKRALKDL